MEHMQHNISLTLAVCIMTCTTLVFFLPAAISMNTPDAASGSEEYYFTSTFIKPFADSGSLHKAKYKNGRLSFTVQPKLEAGGAVASVGRNFSDSVQIAEGALLKKAHIIDASIAGVSALLITGSGEAGVGNTSKH